ncbi:MAG: hypothetical protein FJ271_26405 [Planctomycetes bacterium]|nr:hypothetical protein [Planctomycetota bacterium]
MSEELLERPSSRSNPAARQVDPARRVECHHADAACPSPLPADPVDPEATLQLRGGRATRGAQVGEASLPRLAGFEILEELGRGGMGVVYKAWQLSLQRTVALKMVGAFAGSQDLDRFRAEARGIARLHHPHLVSIYEIGEYRNLPYYAMEYMGGGTLARRLNGQPIDPRVAAELMQSLAGAIDYAHRNGIVHRDLKPANILLSADADLADAVAKITDFGIAKHLDQADSQTRTGDILGTPHYMAPEQAMGQSGQAGPTADVYSLGAILYELLTGRAPFHAYEGADVLFRLIHDEPERPSRLVRGLPRDLQTICLMCLEKTPARRYASAAALADDLRRFLSDEPIQARPASRWDRACRWVRRRPAWAAIIGMTAALAFVGVGLLTMMWRQAVRHAEKQDQLVNAWKSVLADDYLERGIQLAERGDARRGMHLMVRALEVTEELEHTEKKPSLLAPVIRSNLSAWSQCVVVPEKLLAHDDWAWEVGFSPDGKLVFTAGKDKKVKIWDAATGQQIGAALQHAAPVWAVVPHPDGKRLFTLSDMGDEQAELREYVADATRPERFVRRTALALAGDPYGLRINGAGDRLCAHTVNGGPVTLVACADDGLRLVTTLAGEHTDVAFSPDGAVLATIPGTRQQPTDAVQLWDGRSGIALGEPLAHKGAVRTLAFDPSGHHMLVGSATKLTPDEAGESSQLHVWDWRRRKRIAQSPPYFGRVRALAAAPSGQMLAVSLFDYVRGKDDNSLQVTDGHVSLWLLDRDGQITSYGKPLRTHDAVWSMSFSPDSRFLLAGSRNSGAFLWSVSNCQRVRAPVWHEGNCVKVAFRGDGRQAVTASAGGNHFAAARLWTVPSYGHIGLSLPQPRETRHAFWDVDGRDAWFDSDGQLSRWDVYRGAPVEKFTLPALTHFVQPTHERGRFLLESHRLGLHELYPSTGDCVKLTGFRVPPRWDSHYAIAATGTRLLQYWLRPSAHCMLDELGTPVSPLVDESDWELTACRFNRTGDMVAIAQIGIDSPRVRLRLFDPHDMTVRREIPVKQRVAALAFSPDGSTIALGGRDRQVQRVNVRTGAIIGPPLLHESAITDIHYGHDDRMLVTVGEKGQVLLWDAPTGKRIGPAFEHYADLNSIQVNPKRP